MSGRDEVQAILEIREVLKERYPGLPGSLVDDIVTSEYSSLAGPVRIYIPILVEKAAKRRLFLLDRDMAQHRGAA